MVMSVSRTRKATEKFLKWGVAVASAVAGLMVGSTTSAQEPPYFVTYSHDLEEPGNLEMAMKNGLGKPVNGNRFFSTTVELEYGATAWWTTELYLSGESQANDSTIFTGYRWENRFRPLLREHWINPVLYVEYEHVNHADRSLLEVVGHDSVADLALSNAQGRLEKEKSFEMKLILSSRFRGWNVAENFIAEKDISDEPWEFGYALGVSRPLALAASSRACVFCGENFALGAELYGGLGTSDGFGWRATSQYLGPTVAFNIPKGPTVTFSPNFGLNDNSLGVLYRFKVSYEVQQLFGIFHKGN
jgi:hypothetical protein